MFALSQTVTYLTKSFPELTRTTKGKEQSEKGMASATKGLLKTKVYCTNTTESQESRIL